MVLVSGEHREARLGSNVTLLQISSKKELGIFRSEDSAINMAHLLFNIILLK